MKKKIFCIQLIMTAVLITLALRIIIISDTLSATANDNISENDALATASHNSFTEDNPVQETAAYSSLFPDLYASSDNIPDALPDGQKVAYLTFDDGPSSLTHELLDFLKAENIKATFFVMGMGVAEKDSDSLKRLKAIADDGHVIGVHTYSHDYCEIYSSVGSFLNDFNKAYVAITEAVGIKPNIYRFPGGSNNVFIKNTRSMIIDEMNRRGFSFYDWNVSAEDAVGRPTAASIEKNLNRAYSYSYPVLLMHDAYYNERLLKVLPGIVKNLKKQGYSFDTLDNRVPIHFAN